MPDNIGTNPGLVLIPVWISAWHCGHFIVHAFGPNIFQLFIFLFNFQLKNSCSLFHSFHHLDKGELKKNYQMINYNHQYTNNFFLIYKKPMEKFCLSSKLGQLCIYHVARIKRSTYLFGQIVQSRWTFVYTFQHLASKCGEYDRGTENKIKKTMHTQQRRLSIRVTQKKGRPM